MCDDRPSGRLRRPLPGRCTPPTMGVSAPPTMATTIRIPLESRSGLVLYPAQPRLAAASCPSALRASLVWKTFQEPRNRKWSMSVLSPETDGFGGIIRRSSRYE